MTAASDLDVSRVRCQGAYVAKRCPVKAHLDHDTVDEHARADWSEAQIKRMEDGNRFEAEVFDRLIHEHGTSVVHVEGDRDVELIDPTVEAICDEADLILGGALPYDEEARRTGRPDALVRVGDGYVPIDVKHHTLTATTERDGSHVAWSPLDSIDPRDPHLARARFNNGYRTQDGFQLAHYRRMLEAHGFAPASIIVGAVGGIIDKAQRVWWIDLDEPVATRWWSEEKVSLLEWYDWEFAFRLDVIATTLARNDDPSIEPLVEMSRTSECNSCDWWHVCGPALEATDHVSLLPGFGWEKFVHLRRHDLTTRQAVARLDPTTAAITNGSTVSDRHYELAHRIGCAAVTDPTAPVADVVGRRAKGLLRRLGEHDIATAGDLARLDPTTAALPKIPRTHLPSVIDEARAAVAGRVFRARGLDQISVPRADVEVDFDIEFTNDVVYLWGSYVTVRRPGVDIDEGYRSTMSVEPLDDRGELDLLIRWWASIDDLRRAATRAGLTFAVYVYSAAEMSRISGILRKADEQGFDTTPVAGLEQLMSSDQWVDLYEIVRNQLVTGRSSGLKTVAPMAGFCWRDGDAGGEQSTIWYDKAIADPDVRETNRIRLLRYNEDDVRATLAVREWLAAADIPPIEDWTPDRS